MTSSKTQQKIAMALYIIASVLLLIGIYQKGSNIENRYIEVSGWLALGIASVYGIALSIKNQGGQENQTET